MAFPRIVSRKTSILSPWASVLEKEVCFLEGAPLEVYHSISQAPYVAVFAMTLYDPDTGRLSVASSGYFAVCANRLQDGSPGAALEVRYVNLEKLFAMVRAGEFRHQLHIALIASALVHHHIDAPGLP
jgi:hypothetical protein